MTRGPPAAPTAAAIATAAARAGASAGVGGASAGAGAGASSSPLSRGAAATPLSRGAATPQLPTPLSATGGSAAAAAAAAALACAPPPLPPPALGGTYMELSADHSPESESEFARVARFRPHAARPGFPELLFVYDTLAPSKAHCAPIFDARAGGAAGKVDGGSYYKNVRQEWGTLVVTPPGAAFQDALAFTRSLGDFHLQVSGVVAVVVVWSCGRVVVIWS
jgi:hypothetical protein